MLQGGALFLALAFYAHLLYGRNDQSIIESFRALGIKQSGVAVGNWLGFTGAFISYYFVYLWLGITAFICLPFLFIIGTKMVMPKIWPALSLYKVMLTSIFLILWFNILLGYLHTLYPNATIVTDQLGGVGYELGTLFKSLLGYGTLLLLLVSLIIFMVICFNITSWPMRCCFFKKELQQNKELTSGPNHEIADDLLDPEAIKKKRITL